MKRLTAEQIVEQRAAAGRGDTTANFTALDMKRPFIHEHYTQLYHTDGYDKMNDAQRLRYNQLYGMRTNEQFMLFESGFTNRVMSGLLSSCEAHDAETLGQCLHILLEEERRHYRMFHALNKLGMPEIYQHRPYHFLRISPLEKLVLGTACRYPRQLLSLIWLVLLMEEHAVRFSRDMLKDVYSENLGELESNYILAHRLHLQDEAGHVHIDANVIEFVLERSSGRNRKLNVYLLKKLLRATLKPRHVGINVIRHLIGECPELKPQARYLESCIRTLDVDPCLLPLLNDVSKRPVTTALLEAYPEFEQALAL